MGKDHFNIVMPLHEVTIDELNAFYEDIARYNHALPA